MGRPPIINKNQKVHEIKAFITFGRCRKKGRISFAYRD